MSLRKEEAHWREPLPLLALALGGICLGLVVAGIALVLPYRHLSNLNVGQQFASAFIGVTFASVGSGTVPWMPGAPT